jgi:hypothetical protein
MMLDPFMFDRHDTWQDALEEGLLSQDMALRFAGCAFKIVVRREADGRWQPYFDHSKVVTR